MTTYGVTSTGFVIPTLDDVVSEMNEALRAQLGSGLNLVAPSVLATIVGILAEREFSLWEAQLATYDAQYPSTAAGQSLDNVCSITGVSRHPATPGTVVLSVYLNAGVTLPAGQVVSAGTGTATWITTADAVNSGGVAAWVTGVPAICQTTGPIEAVAGAIRTAVSSYSGWVNDPSLGYMVTNPLDATPGVDVETDAQLRVRRTAELALAGSSSINAIRAKLLEVSGVTNAYVFNNDTDAVDSNGLEPHSIEAVVQGGAAADIEQSIWDNLSAGTATNGSQSGTITDSQGFTHTVKFERPSEVDIYVLIECTTGDAFSDGGDAAVREAVAAAGNKLLLGEDVVANKLYAPIYGVSGVLEVTKLWIGTSSPPTAGDDITITAFELAVFDTTRVILNGV